MSEPWIPVDPPREVNTHKKIPSWEQEVIQYVEKYGALDGTSRESKRLQPYFMWHYCVTSLMPSLLAMKK